MLTLPLTLSRTLPLSLSRALTLTHTLTLTLTQHIAAVQGLTGAAVLSDWTSPVPLHALGTVSAVRYRLNRKPSTFNVTKELPQNPTRDKICAP